MPWRQRRFMLGGVGRLGIELFYGVAQGMFGLVGMFMVLGVVKYVLILAIPVHAPLDPEMRCRMGDVAVRVWFRLVSR